MAEGRSNRAIAATAYLSERAVERHVTSIFDKLRLPQTPAHAPPRAGGAHPPALAAYWRVDEPAAAARRARAALRLVAERDEDRALAGRVGLLAVADDVHAERLFVRGRAQRHRPAPISLSSTNVAANA